MPKTRLNAKMKINKPKISANKLSKSKNEDANDFDSIKLSPAINKLCRIKKLTKNDFIIRRLQFLEALKKANDDFEQEKKKLSIEITTARIKKLGQKVKKESMNVFHKPAKVHFDDQVYFETLNDSIKNSNTMDIEYPTTNSNLRYNLRNPRIELKKSITKNSGHVIHNSLNLPLKPILKKINIEDKNQEHFLDQKLLSNN